jgi:hypothetical protein
MSVLPKTIVEVGESAAHDWITSKPDGIRGQVSLGHHVAQTVYSYLLAQYDHDFDCEAALVRFRQVPMEHLENASFETFYMNGARKQFEADRAMVWAFMEGSAEWEDEARIAKLRVKELEDFNFELKKRLASR